MAESGSAPPSGSKTPFDHEDATEVMAVPATPPAKSEPALSDVDDKDKKYVAPRVIPAAATPEKEHEGAKIVLNIPDAKPRPPAAPGRAGRASTPDAGQAVAEVRARRRAPTVKLSRAAVTGAMNAADDIDVTMDEDDPEPPPPLEAPSTPSAPPIHQSLPVGPAPPARRDARSGGGALAARGVLEPPATALPISEPVRTESSKAPWLAVALLALGAAGAGVFVATRAPSGTSPAPARAVASSQATATAQATVASSPEPTAPALAATEAPTAMSGDAASSGSSTSSSDQASAVAVVPPPQTNTGITPPVKTPPVGTAGRPAWTPPASTQPRPPGTFPAKPPPKRTSDIPSSI